MNIMNEIYLSDPKSSFSFIGSPNVKEKKSMTKRYRFYKVMVNTYFGVQTFSHHYYDDKSAYLLIRNSILSENPDIVDEVKSEFIRIYREELL